MGGTLRAMIWAAGAAGLAGCAGAPVVHEPGPGGTSYMDGEFEYAARSGVLRTEVIGNPFGAPADQVERAVTAAMRGANRGPAVEFAARPAGPARDPYKVVVALDLPYGRVNSGICAQSPSPGEAADRGSLPVTAAFCRDGSLMTYATAAAAGPVALDSPQFRALVRDATYAMIPPIDRKNVGGVR